MYLNILIASQILQSFWHCNMNGHVRILSIEKLPEIHVKSGGNVL